MLVDTGRTFSYFYPPIVATIAQEFGAWTEGGEYMVDCATRELDGTVNFGFNNDSIVIRVRYKDFVVRNQDSTCSLGVQPTEYDNVLGDTFIRAAYCER